MTEYVTTTPLQTNFSTTIVERATLRDQFAMAALPSIILRNGIHHNKMNAIYAYETADAMLAAREQKK